MAKENRLIEIKFLSQSELQQERDQLTLKLLKNLFQK